MNAKKHTNNQQPKTDTVTQTMEDGTTATINIRRAEQAIQNPKSVLVFDFDNTLIKTHMHNTLSKLQFTDGMPDTNQAIDKILKSSETGINHLEKIKEAITKQQKSGGAVAIASFSSFPKSIGYILEKSLGEQLAQTITITTARSNQEALRNNAKMPMLDYIKKEFNIKDKQNILLVDDSAKNTKYAQEKGYKTVQVNKAPYDNKHFTTITTFIDDTKKQKAKKTNIFVRIFKLITAIFTEPVSAKKSEDHSAKIESQATQPQADKTTPSRTNPKKAEIKKTPQNKSQTQHSSINLLEESLIKDVLGNKNYSRYNTAIKSVVKELIQESSKKRNISTKTEQSKLTINFDKPIDTATKKDIINEVKHDYQIIKELKQNKYPANAEHLSKQDIKTSLHKALNQIKEDEGSNYTKAQPNKLAKSFLKTEKMKPAAPQKPKRGIPASHIVQSTTEAPPKSPPKNTGETSHPTQGESQLNIKYGGNSNNEDKTPNKTPTDTNQGPQKNTKAR